MNYGTVIGGYFDWLAGIVCDNTQYEEYQMLLKKLFVTPFDWSVHNDDNRAIDGISLRERFAQETNIARSCEVLSYLGEENANVLEVLVALSLRCDEHIMSYNEEEDNPGRWFWLMIENMGIDSQCDVMYDELTVDGALDCMMSRQYDYDGSNGALFVVSNPRKDLREVEIWYQMCWYLNEILA